MSLNRWHGGGVGSEKEQTQWVWRCFPIQGLNSAMHGLYSRSLSGKERGEDMYYYHFQNKRKLSKKKKSAQNTQLVGGGCKI